VAARTGFRRKRNFIKMLDRLERTGPL